MMIPTPYMLWALVGLILDYRLIESQRDVHNFQFVTPNGEILNKLMVRKSALEMLEDAGYILKRNIQCGNVQVISYVPTVKGFEIAHDRIKWAQGLSGK